MIVKQFIIYTLFLHNYSLFSDCLVIGNSSSRSPLKRRKSPISAMAGNANKNNKITKQENKKKIQNLLNNGGHIKLVRICALMTDINEWCGFYQWCIKNGIDPTIQNYTEQYLKV